MPLQSRKNFPPKSLRLFEVPHQKFFHTLTRWRAPAFQEMSLTQKEVKKLWKENLFNNFSAFVAFSSLQCFQAKEKFCCIQFPQWFFPFSQSRAELFPLSYCWPRKTENWEKRKVIYVFLILFFGFFLGSENVRHLYRHRITSCDDLWLYFLLHKFLGFSLRHLVALLTLLPSNHFQCENVTKSFSSFSVLEALASEIFTWHQTNVGKSLLENFTS